MTAGRRVVCHSRSPIGVQAGESAWQGPERPERSWIRWLLRNRPVEAVRTGIGRLLIDSGGEITIGAIPSTNLCAITASDPDQCLAMLRVRPDESIVHMLDRIDAAIGHAWVHEEFIDEING